MENLVKLAEELNSKYNYLRNGLKKFLEKWANATKLDLNDDMLLTVVVAYYNDENGYTDVYFLERGHDYVLKLYKEYYDDLNSYKQCVENAEIIDIDNIDINVIKRIIKELPVAINKYLNELNNKLENINQVIDEFKKEFDVK